MNVNSFQTIRILQFLWIGLILFSSVYDLGFPSDHVLADNRYILIVGIFSGSLLLLLFITWNSKSLRLDLTDLFIILYLLYSGCNIWFTEPGFITGKQFAELITLTALYFFVKDFF